MSKELINITLDLETLSTQEDAAIVQIGCCIPYFDRKHLPISFLGQSCEFEATVKYEDALRSEFHKDRDTLDWWEKQSHEARINVFSGQDSYTDVFDQFRNWINLIRIDGAEVAIWGNGSDFDNRLLTYSLDSLGYHNVWNFRNNRDLRTLKALFPHTIEEDPREIKHTALGDARYEARLLNAIRSVYHLENL